MNKYFGKAIAYSAGNIFNKFLLLFLLPIFTHLLKPEEYAIYVNLTVFISFANLIYFLGIQQSLFSHFYIRKNDDYKFTLISSIYVTIAVFGFFVSSLIILFRNRIPFFLKISANHPELFVFVAVICFADVIYGITLSIINMQEKSINYAILSSVKNLLFFILVLIGYVLGKLSLFNIFLFLTISSVISAFVSLFDINGFLRTLKVQRKIVFSFSIMKSVLSFGLVMIPGTFSMIILRLADRYMLTYLSPNSLHDVGIYAIGYRVGTIMQFPVSIVSLAFFPYAMKIGNSPQAKDSYRRIFRYFTVFGAIFGFLIILFSPEIFLIFIAQPYHEAIKIVFAGVISFYLLGIFNIINLNFYVDKKAGKIATAVILGALLNIILNFIFIPRFGIYGAGIASVIAYLFIVIYNFYFERKFYHTGYKMLPVSIALVLLLSVAALNFVLSTNTTLIFFKMLFLLVLLALFFVYWKKGKRMEIFSTILKKD
ncbi:MAG: hypothetical protein DRZ79_00945 [Candidatus Cloacimonadota bacterium]|nr:MAG: hypothetical protein DRZ79_00945 [Candidatus Cloacimonadota bacterium]